MRGVVLDGALYLTRAVIELDGAATGTAASCSSPAKARSSAAAGARMSRRRRWGWWGSRAGWPRSLPRTTSGSTWCRRAASIRSGQIPSGTKGRTPNAAGIPLGRQGTVDEIAATCLFLVSDDGGFITGQTIHVNGGSGVLLNRRRHPTPFERRSAALCHRGERSDEAISRAGSHAARRAGDCSVASPLAMTGGRQAIPVMGKML